MGKRTALQWYTGDWLRDPRVTMCSAATRGIWFDLLCVMHQDGGTGVVRGTLSQIAKWTRPDSMEQLVEALHELRRTGAAEVEGDISVTCHAEITVMSRRMSREADRRAKARGRKARERERQSVTASVTPKSRGRHPNVTSSPSPSPSLSPSSPPHTPPLTPPPSSPAPSPSPPDTARSSGGPASEPAPGIQSFVLVGGKEWRISADKLREYRGTFPNLDVVGELRKAAQWTRDNQAKRKTERGMNRFLFAWLERAQNRGRGEGERRRGSQMYDELKRLEREGK